MRSKRYDGPPRRNAAPAYSRAIAAGFFVHHVRGSHHYLKHPDKPGLLVSVPFHNRDLKRGTLGAILRQAGMTIDELRNLL